MKLKKKVKGYLCLFSALLLLCCVFAKINVVRAETGTDNFSAQDLPVWVEEEETILEQIEVPDTYALTATNADYTSYSFTKYFNVHDYDKSGRDITLFKVKMTGTVFFYTDGKVHLYSLGSSVESVISNYTATVTSNDITNTDGSLSTGVSTVTTSSSIYAYGTFQFQVKFVYGSSQASYEVKEIGIVRP